MMNDGMKVALGGIGLLMGALTLAWIVEGNQFFLYQFFAPRQAAVERKVFEETKSYNQGMVQELENMMVQYSGASKAGKDTICSVVRHRLSDYPDARIPSHLQPFVDECRSAARSY